jgi:signal transduction histidine kinase/DNA-binding NarL/FixJ family response regulator
LLLDLPQLTATPADIVGLVRAEDRSHLLRAIALARRYDAPGECVVRMNRHGVERTFQLRVQQRDLPGRQIALFGVVSDITDKLAAERHLVAALKEARSAAEFRSQFLATMSHEIRTPMTGVIGMIELLANERSPANRRLYLDTLRRSADLLMAVLNDVLDFSKVDSGQLRFADEPFDLGQALRTTLRLFERAAAARNLRLLLDAPEPDALWVRGDPLRLQQVVSNLLSNAIKFSDQGIVTLRCSASPRARDRLALRLSVQDCGIGIPLAMQDKLFEPFVQAELPAKRGGTGLGLAISRRLVAGMGGRISVRSVEGRGTTFQVDLTLPNARPSLTPRPPQRPRAAVRPLDILLAEDNPINQLLVTALLKRMGHRVTCAADGAIAVATAGERRFDLILMDMQMPRLGGLSAAAAIRGGQGPNAATPILALTADAAERRPLYQDGPIDAVLTKPINSRALADALASWSQASSKPCKGAVTSLVRPGKSPLDDKILAEVRSLLGQARLDQLLDLLADELEARPRAIRDALADRAFDRAAAEAHSLKGAAANLGAGEVAATAAMLERAIAAAAAGGKTGPLAPALRALAEAVSDAQHALAGLPRSALPEAVRA